MVSAGWFDFGSSNDQNIGGITFHIPNDFKEVSQINSVSKDIKVPNAETKYYEYNVSNSMSIKVNDIAITVISGSNMSLDNVKDIKYNTNRNTIIFTDDNHKEITGLDEFDYENATIAGKSGLLLNITGKDLSHYIFAYIQDNKLVFVELQGYSPYVNYDQLEEIIK